MRAECKKDQFQSIAVRKRKAADRYADNVRKKAKHAAKRDRAETVLCTSLMTCVTSLEVQLRARSNSSAARVAFLKDQFHARVSGENPKQYTGIGKEFRSKFGKLKMTPNDVTTSKEKYLHELVTAMIKEDEAMIDNPNTMPHFTEHYIRVLPTLSSDFTNPVASELKAEFAKHIAEIAAPQDDPVYVELQGEYVGQILYEQIRNCFGWSPSNLYGASQRPDVAAGRPPVNQWCETLRRDNFVFQMTFKCLDRTSP